MQRTFNSISDIPQQIINQLSALKTNYSEKHIIYDYEEFLVLQEGFTKKHCAAKKALLSYLVIPLLPPSDKRDTVTFSNAGIAQSLPRALNELGYSVDIVNYNNEHFVPDKKYDLFIGHGGINFETIAKKLDPDCIKIYFSAGIYWREWNQAEEKRLDELQKRRGITLPADKLIERDEEYANVSAEGIICLGNNYAKETYSQFPHVIAINNAVYPDSYSISGKNFENARNNFLFFNGGGNVHKGLDLLLEAFTQVEQHLYIRQDIKPAFFKAYKKELTEYSNIHLLPFLKKPSKEFFSVMDTCNFVISPTCAEGQPGSIIESMAHGLIPILSKEANIDTKNFGITLKDNSVEEIVSAVKEVSQKPVEWYTEKASLIMEEVQNYYTPERFLENMKNAVDEMVKLKNRQ